MRDAHRLSVNHHSELAPDKDVKQTPRPAVILIGPAVGGRAVA